MWSILVKLVRNLRPCVCPPLDLKQLAGKTKGSKHLYQTHETSTLDWFLYHASAQTVHMNPDYNYHFFTADERRQFIEAHFGLHSEQLRAYDGVTHGAIKADVFRLCILYLQGGVYLDCKAATIHPFRDFVGDADFAIFIEPCGCRLGNSFIASSPKNPLITKLMNEATRRILNKEYGVTPYDVAGPEMYYTVVREFLGVDELTPGKFNMDGTKVDLCGFSNTFRSYMYTCSPLRPVIKRQPDYYTCSYLCSPAKLWQRHEVFWYLGKYFN